MGDAQFAIEVTVPVTVPRAVPKELSHLVGLNEAYGVLICKPCKQAVEPGALVRHLKRKHLKEKDKVARSIWREAAAYIQKFPGVYTHSTVDLPEDGSEAQGGLAIQEVWECETCGERPYTNSRDRPFRTSNWDLFQRHRVKEHGLCRMANAGMAQKVPAQSWFLDGRQKYWRIKKAKVAGPEQVAQGRRVDAEGETMATEKVEAEARDRRPGKRRRVTGVEGIGVEALAAEGDGGEAESRGRRMTIDDPKGTEGREAIMANSAKRRASTGGEAGEGGRQKRVQFAEHVEIGGLAGLRQQLDRWSRECIVCYFTAPGQAGSSRLHTVWGCRQEVAGRVRRHCQNMDKWMRKEQAQVNGGGCTECFVPRAVCEGWQWDGRHGQWVEDSRRGCQYAGVLIPMIMAMMELGMVDGVMEVERWLRWKKVDPANKEMVCRWFSKSISWEGIEAGQVVVELMMLARANKLLGGMFIVGEGL
jgi:orsellinic acid/F9775 biosynthesis protein OrsD